MPYESQEERIERLETQVASLFRIGQMMADYIRQNHQDSLRLAAVLADQDAKLMTANLVNLKTIFEHCKAFDEPFRQEMLKMIAQKEKDHASMPSAVDKVNELFGPPLPPDLFGPGDLKN